MAKGKSDKVKMGVLGYIALFFLVLLGAFLICVVVMIFNPGKEILGLAYFKGKGEQIVETTTDTNSEIKLGETSYSEIVVNMDYGTCKIQNTKGYDKAGIVVVNNAKGFGKASEMIDFSYSVKVSSGVLTIDVEQTKGFLYFSSDFEVIINIPCVDDFTKLQNTKLTVKTVSANVEIGQTFESFVRDMHVKELNIETESGSIYVNESAIYSRKVNSLTNTPDYIYENIFDNINLKTVSGGIYLNSDKLESSGEFSLSTETGSITGDLVKTSGVLKLASKTGKIEINQIDSPDTDVKTVSSIINIGTIDGCIDFSNSSEIIDSPNIYIKQVENFLMPVGNNSNVNIDLLIKSNGSAGDILCRTTSGNVNLLNCGDRTYISTVSGNINVESRLNSLVTKLDLKTESGNITVNYKKIIKGRTEISSKNGQVNINFNSASKTKFVFHRFSEVEESFDLSKIYFDNSPAKNINNPFYYECSDESLESVVEITTDGNVYFDLITEDSFGWVDLISVSGTAVNNSTTSGYVSYGVNFGLFEFCYSGYASSAKAFVSFNGKNYDLANGKNIVSFTETIVTDEGIRVTVTFDKDTKEVILKGEF